MDAFLPDEIYVVLKGSQNGFNLAETIIGNCEAAGERALPVFSEEWTARAWLRTSGLSNAGARVFPLHWKLVRLFAQMLRERGTRYCSIDAPSGPGAACEFHQIELLTEMDKN